MRSSFAAALLASVTLAGSPTPGSAPASAPQSASASDDPVARGAYLFHAGGCVNCHTDAEHGGAELAGGVEIRTAFGTFFGTNITPDPRFGIGAWSEADFLRAMREGIGPGGELYYPVFPYTSFTRMTDADLRDLWAWLRTVPPSSQPSRSPQVKALYRPTFLRSLWRCFNFTPGPLRPDPTRSPEWNRGAYLVLGPTHCGECHTPRGITGGLDNRRMMAGSPNGAEGKPVPNITPDRETGIGAWGRDDLVEFLKSGQTPDGDISGSLMAEVIDNDTSHLADADLRAIALYLSSLPPVHHQVGKPKNPEPKSDW